MNSNVEKLYRIASKEERLMMGLMSGTSLDGLDLALCKLRGSGPDTSLDLVEFATVPYENEYVDRTLKIFSKEIIHLGDLSGLNAWVAHHHAGLIQSILASWGVNARDIDLLASHGQTVYHGPQSLRGNAYPNHTLQVGDGDHLAVLTGIITCSDFRQKHIAAGGEGAPLVQYGDYLLFSDQDEDRILLNLGGIANFTYLPARKRSGGCAKIWATDLGPANTMMNQFMQQRFGLGFDKNAECASRGTVDAGLLASLLEHEFYNWPFPKTTGPELFNFAYLSACISKQSRFISDEDILSTLCEMAVQGVSKGVENILKESENFPVVYVSGGGTHNPLMMGMLRKQLPAGIVVRSFDVLGLPGDAKEAALFAVLANETLAGSPEHFKALDDVPAVCMGKISFPS